MTEEQLAIAEPHRAWHAEVFGDDNTTFRLGYIEKLDALGLEEASFDVMVSNCVLNLSPHKEKVLSDVFGLLKPGGEFFFSDIYSDRRVPAMVRHDPVLYGECLGGALYWNDFLCLAKAAGFTDPCLVADHVVTVNDPAMQDKIGDTRLFSATYRLFKLHGLESHCEDYGQAVVYRGNVAYSEHAFLLDKHHVIEKARMFSVCGNTYRMLSETRFAPSFDCYGNTDIHYGIFSDCGTSMPFSLDRGQGQGHARSGCC
jgi:arsenite methyltransferase